MITKKKSLAQIEFDIRHDAWIKADYQGPVITPDGEENEYAVSRRSKITGVTNWFDRLTKNPRYYRKPTEEEIQVLAKIEYEKLSKEERNKQNEINQCREAAKKYVAECNTKGRVPNIAEAVRICRAHD